MDTNECSFAKIDVLGERSEERRASFFCFTSKSGKREEFYLIRKG